MPGASFKRDALQSFCIPMLATSHISKTGAIDLEAGCNDSAGAVLLPLPRSPAGKPAQRPAYALPRSLGLGRAGHHRPGRPHPRQQRLHPRLAAAVPVSFSLSTFHFLVYSAPVLLSLNIEVQGQWKYMLSYGTKCLSDLDSMERPEHRR